MFVSLTSHLLCQNGLGMAGGPSSAAPFLHTDTDLFIFLVCFRMDAGQAWSSEPCDQWRLAVVSFILKLSGGRGENPAFDYLLKAQVAAFELQGVYSVGEEMEIKTWWQDGVRPVGQWLSTELGYGVRPA